jgi:iron-sulfur cluster assembly protein
MDCGTCEAVTITEAPEPTEVTLTITDIAAEMLQEAFGEDQNSALLVGVLSGGCSGYMYDLQIIEGAYPDCQELTLSGFKILVPNASSHLLNGIEIDYETKLMGGGFKINNPNASASCGCGESFA